MKIETIETFPLKIPGRPYLGGHTTSDAGGSEGDYIAHRQYRSVYSLAGHSLLVKLTTDTGLVGWGECQAAVAPRVTAAALHELIAPVYRNADPRQVAVLRDQAYDRMRERGHDGGFLPDAIAACDIAVWDLLGKHYGVPVYQLLGGSYHTELPCYVSGVPAEDVEEQAGKIQQWMDRGFSQIKISLGYGVDADIAHVRRLRERVGDGFRLGIDLHWVYRLADARRLCRGMEPLNIWFLECALVPEELENQAKLAQFSARTGLLWRRVPDPLSLSRTTRPGCPAFGAARHRQAWFDRSSPRGDTVQHRRRCRGSPSGNRLESLHGGQSASCRRHAAVGSG